MNIVSLLLLPYGRRLLTGLSFIKIMNIILFICIIAIVVIMVLNIIACVISLGYVSEEKHPNRKGLYDRIEIFWIKFWRKIIK